MIERWKRITNTSYDVSSHGRVCRALPGISTYVGKLIKLSKNHKGYITVQLLVHGKNKKVFVHKLVAQELIGPRPKGKQVNHKDLDKTNNWYTNLEYKTGKQNIDHAVLNGAKFGAVNYDQTGLHNHNVKLNWDIVKKIRKLDISNKYTQQEIADKFGISQALVWPILKHKTWKVHCGE